MASEYLEVKNKTPCILKHFLDLLLNLLTIIYNAVFALLTFCLKFIFLMVKKSNNISKTKEDNQRMVFKASQVRCNTV